MQVDKGSPTCTYAVRGAWRYKIIMRIAYCIFCVLTEGYRGRTAGWSCEDYGPQRTCARRPQCPFESRNLPICLS